MRIHDRIGVGLLLTLSAATWCGGALAQGTKTEEAGKVPVVELPTPEDSGIKAILETNPTTPSECARAAKILADFQRPALAKKFLKKILDAKLDQQQLVALEAEFGSGMFVPLSTRVDLLPEGKQVGDAVLLAAEKELTAPDRLVALVKQLNDPSIDVRYRAMDGLRRARGAAVAPLVQVLTDPSRMAEYPNVREMLIRLGRDAVGPLTGALEAPDPKLLASVSQLLADMQARQAVVFLVAPCVSEQNPPETRQAVAAALARLTGQAPTKADAAQVLAKRAREHFEQAQPLPMDENGRVEIWSWDKTAKQPVVHRYAPADASRLLAARLAREAYSIRPDDPAIRRLYLATLLEQAAYELGLDKPLPTTPGFPAAIVAEQDWKVIEDVLVFAMDTGHAPAATAAVRILGAKDKAEDLLAQGPQPAPLVRATRQPDARLRFAAMEAILKLKPSQPFAGSSQIPEALGFFLATTGSRRALVADLVREDARRIGGLFSGLGYQVDTAVTGAELVRQATTCPDYEFIMIAASLGESTVEQILQRLHYDCRTAAVPIGVLGRLGQAELTDHLTRGDRMCIAFVRPHTQEDARWQVEQLTARLGPRMVSFDERQAQAAAAMRWTGELMTQKSSVFDVRGLKDLLLVADRVPTLAPQAAAVLGSVGTPQAQVALVEQASQHDQPLAVRKAALAAFRESVEKHGVLLTSQQILLQYDRYNQSAALDPSTQQVLGFILDCIEARASLSAPKGPAGRQGKLAPDKGQPKGK